MRLTDATLIRIANGFAGGALIANPFLGVVVLGVVFGQLPGLHQWPLLLALVSWLLLNVGQWSYSRLSTAVRVSVWLFAVAFWLSWVAFYLVVTPDVFPLILLFNVLALLVASLGAWKAMCGYVRVVHKL